MFTNHFVEITPLTRIATLREREAGQRPGPNAGTPTPFAEIFGTVIRNVRETEAVASNNAARVALGDVDDLHTLGIDATRAFLAGRLAVELRNRTVEGYTELMRINL